MVFMFYQSTFSIVLYQLLVSSHRMTKKYSFLACSDWSLIKNWWSWILKGIRMRCRQIYLNFNLWFNSSGYQLKNWLPRLIVFHIVSFFNNLAILPTDPFSRKYHYCLYCSHCPLKLDLHFVASWVLLLDQNKKLEHYF